MGYINLDVLHPTVKDVGSFSHGREAGRGGAGWVILTGASILNGKGAGLLWEMRIQTGGVLSQPLAEAGRRAGLSFCRTRAAARAGVSEPRAGRNLGQAGAGAGPEFREESTTARRLQLPRCTAQSPFSPRFPPLSGQCLRWRPPSKNRILVTVETVYALLTVRGPGTAHGVYLSLVGSVVHTVQNPPSERPGFSGGR